MKNIAITLPATIEWEEYEKELRAVEDWKKSLYFKVPKLPKKKPERCYLVHKGRVVGWMKIVGLHKNASFTCAVTDKRWSGNFIERSGPLHVMLDYIPMKGFRGFRYYEVKS